MSADRDARWVSRALVIAGAALIAFGVLQLASVPRSPSMPDDSGFMEGRKSIDDIRRGNDAWMDDNRAHDAALVRGEAGLGFGIILLVSGAALSRRGRSLSYGLTEQYAAAVGRGISRGMDVPNAGTGTASARLAQLDDLRAKGLISDAEHADKRRAIVAEL